MENENEQKRKAASPAVIAMLAAAAAAAAIGAYLLLFGGPSARSEPVVLSIWHVYGNQTLSPMNELIDEFNKTKGAEEGVKIMTTALTDGHAIDDAVIASAHGDPGSQPMPDLFTIYPSVVQHIGADRLVDWREVLPAEIILSFVEEFLAEGSVNSKLCVLPIAKSTELLFANHTLLERVGLAETAPSFMASYESLFDNAAIYSEEHGGLPFMQFDSFFTYFLTQVASMGGELISRSRIDASSAEFERAFMPLARSILRGGVCIDEGYASARWNTGHIVCNISSSAGILYLPTKMTFDDNSSIDIEKDVLTLPTFARTRPTMISRGAGLAAIKSDDPKRQRAIAIFAEWLASPEQNIRFVTSAGYMPVTKDAFAKLFADTSVVKDPSFREVYDAIKRMYGSYTFVSIPLYNGSGQDQKDLDRVMKDTMRAARVKYARALDAGIDKDAACEDLAREALARVRSSIRR